MKKFSFEAFKRIPSKTYLEQHETSRMECFAKIADA